MAERYPKRFGKYVLLKPLARGGMGEIYVAAAGEVGGFEKLCVIKKVLTEKTDRAKANRFLDEAKVVLRLSHANLVLTFDAGDVEGEFYIAMELIEGKDLREIWNRCVRTRTRIPLDVALHIVRDLARALSYVHSYGDLHLVHRDIAPPNILVSYFGEVKLTDFGLARSVLKQEHTAPGVVFGRASYLAPEQARGEVADARTDVYSLGVVLWELLTGQQYLQLANLDPVTALTLVRHPKPLPPSMRAPWITPELDAIAMKALAPDRNLRFQSADEMRLALSEVIAHVAPRADSERAADFLRGLYGPVIRDEHEERERLLKGRTSALREVVSDASDRTPRPVTPAVGSASTKLAAQSLSDADEPTKVWRTPTVQGTMPLTPLPNIKPADFVGRVIDGRYRLLRQIGEGGMGTVYAGEHVGIGKGVAVKILHPVFSRQQDLVERFRREARAASRIGHPNIIDVTDFGTTEEGCAYFAMEHLDGIDLADVLALERRIDPERAVQIAIQICRALHAAHAAGVIHRDLKPENVFLVARNGQADFVKVLDFGIARSLNRNQRRLTNPGMAMGTPEYMAPEQASGGPPDKRSDIYSVGALLYEMLLGIPPHAGGAQQDVLAGRAPVEPRRPREVVPTLPDDLDDIILRALHRDPSRRYQTMAQLEYELTKSLWGRPRAVADLLGFRDPARNETPSGSFRRNFLLDREIPDAAAEAGMAAMANTAPLAVPGVARLAGTIDSGSGWPTPTGSNRVPTPPPYPSPVGLIRPTGLPAAATGGGGALSLPVVRPADVLGSARAGLRVGGAMLLLGLAVVGSVLAYQRLPWLHGESAPVVTAPARAPVAAAPSDPALRAARLRELSAQVEALLRRPSMGSGDVPAVQELAARLTGEKELAAAEKLRADAASKLAAQAVVGAQTGKLDDAPRTFAAAVALDVKTPSDGFVRALAQRGEALMGAGQSAEAARWAREALRWNPADVEARALLGSALLASGDFSGAMAEIQAAVSARPADPSLRRLLVRARAHRTQPPIGDVEPPPRARRRSSARPAAAASASPATLNPGDDILPKENPPLAPGQPTPKKE